MKATELRLGNLIYGVSDRVETITLIKEDDYIQSYPGKLIEAVAGIDLKWCSPIPLTREILDKTGFTNKIGDMYYSRFRFIYKPQYNYWYVVDEKENTYLNKIEFVHELQNFIWIMDGNELDVKI